MKKDNKNRNRNLIAVTFDIDYKRFKFRENRKSVIGIFSLAKKIKNIMNNDNN